MQEVFKDRLYSKNVSPAAIKQSSSKKATRPTQSKAHYVDQEEADEAGNDTSELGLFTIHTINGRHTGPINVTPEVTATSIQMVLDTGASVTLISAKVWKISFNKIPLQDASVVLRTYIGEPLKIKRHVW